MKDPLLELIGIVREHRERIIELEKEIAILKEHEINPTREYLYMLEKRLVVSSGQPF